VTIAMLFTALMLLVNGALPSLFHSTLLFAGLVSIWFTILMTGVNRL
jgi:hypothetical protein